MPRVRNVTGTESIEIQKLRERTQMTQLDFSAMFNIPLNNLQKWEQGINRPPIYVIQMMTRIIDMSEEIDQLKSNTK